MPAFGIVGAAARRAGVILPVSQRRALRRDKLV